MSRDAAEARADQILAQVEPHPWRAFILQTTISWAALIVVQIGVSLFEFGFFHPSWDGGIATVGAPIGAAILAVLTNLVVIILGLPLRFVAPANRWIRRHRLVPLFVAVGGLLLVVISFLVGKVNSGVDAIDGPYAEFDPNYLVFLTGWFAIALGLTHTWTDYMQKAHPNGNPPPGTYPIPPI